MLPGEGERQVRFNEFQSNENDLTQDTIDEEHVSWSIFFASIFYSSFQMEFYTYIKYIL